MTAHNRSHRTAGVDRGTALLALATCLIFAAGIAAISRSVTEPAAATICIAVGLFVALRILPRHR